MLQRAIFLWSFLLIVQKKAVNFLRIESPPQMAIVSKSFWTRMNVSYMNNVKSFLDTINAEIDTIYAMNRFWDSSGIYVMKIIKLLKDTMYVLDYIPAIKNSGFFRYVQPCEVPEESGSLPHPNDQLFPDQTYLYQERGPLDPNHDISAPVDVLRVKRPSACQDALRNSMDSGGRQACRELTGFA